jgi:ABC-type Zn uptake system ZnuABC Zn-binding protein ZnuA
LIDLSRATAAVVMLGLASAACASAPSPVDSRDTLLIATSVSPITSIVASVAGDRAEVVGMVPEGVNSHTFEPRPSLAELLSTADVVYLNGLDLEEPTKALALANLRKDADLIELGSLTLSPEQYIFDFSFPEADGRPNPHLWTDPTLVRRYAEIVRDDLSVRDPTNAGAYRANAAALLRRIDDLDAAMRAAFDTIPQRVLLTYHDAYAYFARTYGWDVLGAIQVSDFEDPTPSEVASLIEQVRALDVPAIFGSEVFPSPVLRQIGEEAGVRYVDELRDDDLPGKPGDAEHSWFGLMRQNYIVMTTALGGDASALEALAIADPTAGVPLDEARYPQ